MSRYDFIELDNGFEIRGRTPVRVTLNRCKTNFQIQYKDDTHWGHCGLFEYYNLSGMITDIIMTDWKPNSTKGTLKIKKWAKQQTGKAIGHRLYEQWKRLLGMVDPVVLEVQRSVFASTYDCPKLLNFRDVYDDKYLSRDLVNYRAAAWACKDISIGTVMYFCPSCDDSKRCTLLDVDYKKGIEFCKNWMAYYSIQAPETYTSLNRTLMNLPGNVGSIILNLKYVYLLRPITSRLELLTLSYVAKKSNMMIYRDDDRWQPIEQSILKSFQFIDESNIRQAIRVVDEYLNTKTDLRSQKKIFKALGIIFDYPGFTTFKGNFVNLAKESVKWHNDAGARRHELELAIDQEKESFKRASTKAPAIALPQNPHIKFLNSVQEVYNEGELMGHCIGGYAKDAVNGLCYLFHVDYKDCMATIEVSPQGDVTQAHGPHNQSNVAVAYAERELKRWGKMLKDEHNREPATRTTD